MSDAFLQLSPKDRADALEVASAASARPVHLLEKDVWVVWALSALFDSRHGDHLVFKGGTSLSKAYGVIRRFSEDVDLTYDIRELAPDLVGTETEPLPRTRSQEKKWTKEIRGRLRELVRGDLLPLIADAAISGASIINRPGMQRLLLNASERRFDVVVTEKP